MGDVIEQYAVGSFSIQRWRRFGMDRLYVQAEGGRAVGWVDLETGERVLLDGEDAELFERTVENWRLALPFGQLLSV
ncbi:MAG TPA: hypothetical protein VFN50_12830 [Acidimicrobiales bacterium]|nr:hypothetical protein [Acidimicrobiales bacterium]